MRTITHAEQMDLARARLRILEAKLAIADEQTVIAQIKATRAIASVRKAQDRIDALNALTK